MLLWLFFAASFFRTTFYFLLFSFFWVKIHHYLEGILFRRCTNFCLFLTHYSYFTHCLTCRITWRHENAHTYIRWHIWWANVNTGYAVHDKLIDIHRRPDSSDIIMIHSIAEILVAFKIPQSNVSYSWQKYLTEVITCLRYQTSFKSWLVYIFGLVKYFQITWKT